MYGREKHVLLRHYLEQGMSKAAIARELGVDRRTIYRWVGDVDRGPGEDLVRYGPRVPKPTKLDPYKGIIQARLEGLHRAVGNPASRRDRGGRLSGWLHAAQGVCASGPSPAACGSGRAVRDTAGSPSMARPVQLSMAVDTESPGNSILAHRQHDERRTGDPGRRPSESDRRSIPRGMCSLPAIFSIPRRRPIGFWRKALAAMGAAEGLQWWILPGNHDSLAAESLWDRIRGQAPDSVHLVDAAAPIEIAPGAVLLPSPVTLLALPTRGSPGC